MKWLYISLLCVLALFNACTKSEVTGDDSENTGYGLHMDPYYYSKLKNTSWKVKSHVSYSYDENGEIEKVTNNFSRRNQEDVATWNTIKNTTYHFYGDYVGSYECKLEISSIPGAGEWYFDGNDELVVLDNYYLGNDCNMSATQRGRLIAALGGANWKIISLSDNEMVVNTSHQEFYESIMKLEKVPFLFNSSSNSNGSASGSEVPEIGFYDATPSKNSIKVSFKIFNKDKVKISKAVLHYGTTVSTNKVVAASIVGANVNVTLSGLTSNTKYFVKLSVSGDFGTVASDTVIVSTL